VLLHKLVVLLFLILILVVVLALINNLLYDNDHDEHFRNNEENESKDTGFSLHEIPADCCFRLVNFQLMKFYEHNYIVFVSYLNYMLWGASRHDVVWGRWRLLSCLLMKCCVLERVLDLIIKLWLMFGSRHLGIMVTRNLWSARVWVRDWLCKGKTHHPQCTLPKVSCIVVWLFFSKSGFYSLVCSKVQSRSLFIGSLYLIELNPNRSKVWSLASHFYTLYL
jgi:hypothetical protein